MYLDRQTKTVEYVDCEGIRVAYTQKSNGSGLELRKEFLGSFKETFQEKTFNRVFEWCSGPGFFAYTLLANKIAKTICLADIYEPALELARQTAHHNNVADLVTTYNSDNWSNIPQHERFDLIIANPPHFGLDNYMNEVVWNHDQRIYMDPGWNIHREFFRGVKQHLDTNGSIFLMEHVWGSGVKTFAPMIEENDLQILGHSWGKTRWESFGRPVWYLHVGHRN